MFKSINKVIKILIFSDLFLNAAFGLLAPIFAIFILENIEGGSAKIAGFAAAVYWLVKSLLQVPIGRYLDKSADEKADFYFMVSGVILSGLAPFGYLISSLPWHIYLLQIINAVGMAMAVPAWSAIFTRHIDKGKEAYEWSLQSTSLGIGEGIAGAAGGFLAATIGFELIFVLVGILSIFSGFLFFFIQKEITVGDKTTSNIPPFKKPF